MLNCTICFNVLVGNQTKFCSRRCRNKHHRSRGVYRNRGLKRKFELVMKFGGGCEICTYRKNLAGLQFHHKDPTTKKFELTVGALSDKSWKAILEEIEKCQLLCALCHTELHNPTMDFVLVNDRYTTGSLNSMRIVEKRPITHGTMNGYNKQKCRCRACKDANNNYFRNRTARRREQQCLG